MNVATNSPVDESSLKKYITTESYKHLYDSLPISLIISLIINLLLPIIFRPQFPLDRVVIVVNLIMGTSIFRGIIYFLYRKDKKLEKLKKLRYLYNTGLLLNTLAWSSAAFFLFDTAHLLHQFLLILIYGGLVAGGLATLSAVLPLVLSFTQILLLPFTFFIFFSSGEASITVALFLVLYNIFTSIASVKLHRQFFKNLRLQYKYLSAARKLSLSEQRYQTIFNEALIGIIYYNKDLVVEDCNSGIAKILQTSVSALHGLNMNNLKDDRVFPAMSAVLKNIQGHYQGPYHTMTSDIDVWLVLRTSPILNIDGQIIGGVAIVEDHTEKMQIQEAMEFQIYHDTLTGLSNRKLLLERLNYAVKTAKRHQHVGALLYLDLDKFKKVNDTLGHQTGDLLLKEVAARLLTVVRTEDTVCRLGGDEFVILLPEVNDNDNGAAFYAQMVASRLHEELSKPIKIEGHTVDTSVSVGISLFTGENDSDEIMKTADIAMYHSKESGRNKTSFFHAQLEQHMQKQLKLEMDLKEALKNGSLDVYFQPIIDLNKNCVSGAESLLRWNHPEQGFISPIDIIQTAENTGQILPLGAWIISTVLKKYAAWKKKEINFDYISINISIKQILQESFVKEISDQIIKSQVPPEEIVLEITESVLISDFEETVKKMQALKEFGVKFALDDFGTGYSSLSYLKKLPLNKLKIDRSFIEDVITDKDNRALIEIILSISDHFELSVITEGVETEEQKGLLANMGCNQFQGYYFSKPLPEAKFLDFVGSLSNK